MSRLNRIDARVRELEESFARLRQSVDTARSETIEVDLAGDLGSVEVTGAGELAHVDLDVEELRFTTAEALADQLTEAINEAETAAARARRAATGEIRRPSRR